MQLRQPFALAAFVLSGLCSAQLGGNSAFRVLDIPASARASALGGNYIAVKDNDINLGIFNPGLLNPEMGRQVALSYLPYFEGVKIGYASYAHHFDSLKTTFSGDERIRSVSMADVSGRIVGFWSGGLAPDADGRLRLALPDCPTGIYFLKMETGGKVLSRKVVLQN